MLRCQRLKGRFSAGAMASPPPRLHQPGEAGGAERDVRSCAWSTPARPVHMCTEAVLPRAELGLPPYSLSASDRVAGAHRSAASSCGRCAHGARLSRTSCCARGRDQPTWRRSARHVAQKRTGGIARAVCSTCMRDLTPLDPSAGGFQGKLFASSMVAPPRTVSV